MLPFTDNPVESSVRHRLRTLRERLNRSRKSAPMMGWGTSATIKTWGKERRRHKIEFGHAFAKGNARLVDSLDRETTAEPLAICENRGDDANVST